MKVVETEQEKRTARDFDSASANTPTEKICHARFRRTSKSPKLAQSSAYD